MDKKPQKRFLEEARKRAKEDDLDFWTEERIVKLAQHLEDYDKENSIRLREYEFN